MLLLLTNVTAAATLNIFSVHSGWVHHFFINPSSHNFLGDNNQDNLHCSSFNVVSVFFSNCLYKIEMYSLFEFPTSRSDFVIYCNTVTFVYKLNAKLLRMVIPLFQRTNTHIKPNNLNVSLPYISTSFYNTLTKN